MTGIYPHIEYSGFLNQEKYGDLSVENEEAASLVSAYNALVEDLSRIGLDNTQQAQLFRILGAILLLRNLSFIKKTASGIPSKEKNVDYDEDSECMVDNESFEVKTIGQLLGVEDNIGDLLSKKFITSVRAEDNYFVSLTFAQARLHARMVAVNLYEMVFSWITNLCNENWVIGGKRKYAGVRKSIVEYYVDVIDYLPVSNLEENGFNELMTNYCCEKFHHHYFSSFLRNEIEQVHLSDSNFEASDGLLHLLDSEVGILTLFDEQCLLSRAGQDDSTAFHQFFTNHVKNKKLFSRSKTSQNCFTLKHYNGDKIMYNIVGFSKENKGEKLGKEFFSAFGKSKTNSVLSEIFKNVADDQQARDHSSSRRGKSKIHRTQISLTKSSVSHIINSFSATSSKFIKCCSLSSVELRSRSHAFDVFHVVTQLKSLGIADLIKLKRIGFSESYTWPDIHSKLIANKLYPSLSKYSVDGDELFCKKVVQGLFQVCKEFLNDDFWYEPSVRELVQSGQDLCIVQVDALDKVLFYKKCMMKDRICRIFAYYRLRQRILRKKRSRIILGRFFRRVLTRRSWTNLQKNLMARFMPLKFFLLRWIVNYRVKKRSATKKIMLFLNRRVWKSKVRIFLETERAKIAKLRNSMAKIIQKYFLGYIVRSKYFYKVVVLVRERLLASKHRKYANIIYR